MVENPPPVALPPPSPCLGYKVVACLQAQSFRRRSSDPCSSSRQNILTVIPWDTIDYSFEKGILLSSAFPFDSVFLCIFLSLSLNVRYFLSFRSFTRDSDGCTRLLDVWNYSKRSFSRKSLKFFCFCLKTSGIEVPVALETDSMFP